MKNNEAGFALITVFLLITVMTALAGSYLVMTRSEILLARSSKDSSSGFNAAEAGLNLRAGLIKRALDSFNLPSGVSPNSVEDCDTSSSGSGDFECRTYNFDNGYKAITYVQEEAEAINILVPPGLPFQGLNAVESRYTVASVGRGVKNNNQALLGLTFRARSVPLFQFGIFFEDDLEFFNGNEMIVNGPVHGNSAVYLASQSNAGPSSLSFQKQITVAEELYRGRKSTSSCTDYTSLVRAYKNTPDYIDFSSCSSSRHIIDDVTPWEEKVISEIGKVKVPSIEEADAFGDGPYWLKADLRLVLKLNSSNEPDTSLSSTGIVVMNTDNSIDVASTSLINSCSGDINGKAIASTWPGSSGDKLRLYREHFKNAAINNYETTLEIDTRNLLSCLYHNPSIIDSKALNEVSDGGLVFFPTIDGNLSSAGHNNYTIRLRNSERLKATTSSAPLPKGLTVVTDQRIVVWGDYNSNITNWIPSSIIADSTYLLSNAWQDTDSLITSAYNRAGSDTTVRTALLSGVKMTGGANGVAGQDQGNSSRGGGVINIFRFNEWFRQEDSSADTDFTYEGSMVSLGEPRHSQSDFYSTIDYYSAPNREYNRANCFKA